MPREHPEWRLLAVYYILACAADGYAMSRAVSPFVGGIVGLVMLSVPAMTMTRMKAPRKIALWVIPIAILGATVLVVVHLARSEHNTAVKWTAIGAVLTGATLVIAVLGLPLALIQLNAVQRGVARLARESDVERRLTAHRLRGLELLAMQDLEKWVCDYRAWVENGATLIREVTDDAEAETFRNLPAPSGQPTEQLQAQLDYIRTDLIPKVRAGYWTSSD